MYGKLLGDYIRSAVFRIDLEMNFGLYFFACPYFFQSLHLIVGHLAVQWSLLNAIQLRQITFKIDDSLIFKIYLGNYFSC